MTIRLDLRIPIASAVAGRSLILDPSLDASPGYPPYPAPGGYRWEVETYNGTPVTYNGQPCFYLRRTA